MCDRSAAPEPKGDLRYGLLSVGLARGRFHPKLMLMSGTLKTTGKLGLWLSVGSGNLSLSGWGLNREVVAGTPVIQQHADALRPLLAWLELQATNQLPAADASEEGDVRNILGTLLAALNDRGRMARPERGTPSLHLAFPAAASGKEPQPLLAALTDGHRWHKATVVSPYWSNVGELVQALGVGQCTLVPSSPDGVYRFPYATLKDEVRRFCDFEKFGGEVRFTHAKCIWLDDGAGRSRFALGSANFTQAAMQGTNPKALANIEAMLRFEQAVVLPKLLHLDVGNLSDGAGDEAEPGAPVLPPFDSTLYYDWTSGAFGGQLTVAQGESVRNVKLVAAGISHTFKDSNGGRQELPRIPLRCLRPVRSFNVSYVDSSNVAATFTGLVMQVNGSEDQLQYRPRPVLSKVLAFLRDLDAGADDTEQIMRKTRLDGSGDGEDDSFEPNFDFHALFQGTWKLHAYYCTASKREKAKKATANNVSMLYRAIISQPAATTEEKIGRYVQLAELESLIESLEREGFVMPEGDIHLHIVKEIAEMRADLKGLLERSPVFQKMFPIASSKKVGNFLNWFHAAIKEEVRDAA